MSRFVVFLDVMSGKVTALNDTKDYSFKTLDNLVSIMKGNPPAMFDIQNVFDSYFPDGETSDSDPISERVAPSIPPFETNWLEWSGPNDIRLGVWFGYHPHPDGRRDEWMTVSFMRRLGETTIIPAGVSIEFDEDGFVVEKNSFKVYRHEGLEDNAYQDVAKDICVSTAIVPVIAFMFCHCKNIEIVERFPKRHEQREAKRRGEPILKYHEIVIDPKRSLATSETGHNVATEPSVAFHLVRGHFAHYTEDKPLFGKYVGSFYHRPHARGSKKFGEVKSTYTVRPGDIGKAA